MRKIPKVKRIRAKIMKQEREREKIKGKSKDGRVWLNPRTK